MNFISRINLESDTFAVDRVYNHKEVTDLVKFDAGILETEVATLGSDGTFKISEKNMCYKLSTKSNQKFSTFGVSIDQRLMVSAGTVKDHNGVNTTTLYAWNHSKKGLLRKGNEIEIESLWVDGNFIDNLQRRI